MPDFYLGQIILGAWSFAPRGTAFCNGQLLAISSNEALFSLLGTNYGGDGRTTFGLPDLRGRVPVHFGQGPGLSNRPLGQKSGTEFNRLAVAQLPAHGHGLATGSVAIPVSTEDADQDEANGHFLANGQFYHAAADGIYGGGAINLQGDTTLAGGGQDINNMQPALALNYVIALQGIYPSRN
ncbi:MAG: tail fiber protein [Bacteroidota bacterium]